MKIGLIEIIFLISILLLASIAIYAVYYFEIGLINFSTCIEVVALVYLGCSISFLIYLFLKAWIFIRKYLIAENKKPTPITKNTKHPLKFIGLFIKLKMLGNRI